MATRDPIGRMMTFRWVMTGLSAILAVAFLVSGFVIIGVVLAAMTVMRVVMLLRWRQRRNELGARFPRRFGDPEPPQ